MEERRGSLFDVERTFTTRARYHKKTIAFQALYQQIKRIYHDYGCSPDGDAALAELCGDIGSIAV